MLLNHEFYDILLYMFDQLYPHNLCHLLLINKQMHDIVVSHFKGNSNAKYIYDLSHDIVVDMLNKPKSKRVYFDEPKYTLSNHTKIRIDILSDYYLTGKYSRNINLSYTNVKYLGGGTLYVVKKIQWDDRYISYIYNYACKYGNYDIIHYLLLKYNPPVNYNYYKTMLGPDNYDKISNIEALYSIQQSINTIINTSIFMGVAARGNDTYMDNLLTQKWDVSTLSLAPILKVAYKYGHLSTYTLLLKHNCNVSIVGDHFNQLCKNNNIQWVKEIKHYLSEHKLFDGLISAINNGHLDVVNIILDNCKLSDRSISIAIGRSVCSNSMITDALFTYLRKKDDAFIQSALCEYVYTKYNTDISNYIEYLDNHYKVNNAWLDTTYKILYIIYNEITFKISIHEYLCVKLLKLLKTKCKIHNLNDNIRLLYNLCVKRNYNIRGICII